MTKGRLIAEHGREADGLRGMNPLWSRTKRQETSGSPGRDGDDTGDRDEDDAGDGDERFFYLNDHLGTAQKIVDSQARVVWRQRSTAFGETRVDENSQITSNLSFPGQYFVILQEQNTSKKLAIQMDSGFP